MARLLRASPLLLVLVAIGAPGPGRAASRLQLDPILDGSIVGGAVLVRLGLPLVAPAPPVFEEPLRDPPGGLDGIAPLHVNENFARASDWALWGTFALSLGAVTVDGARGDRLGINAVILAEGLLVTTALTDASKRLSRRPRPYTYSSPTGSPFDSASFFSGHSSAAAVAAFTAARLIDLQNGLAGWEQVALYGGATTLVLGVGTLRIAGGLHFPTDVLVGVGVGAAIGLLLPALHVVSDPSADRATGRSEPLVWSFAGQF